MLEPTLNQYQYWYQRLEILEEPMAWSCEPGIPEQKKMLDAALYILNHNRSKDLKLILTPKNELHIEIVSCDATTGGESKRLEPLVRDEVPNTDKPQYVN
jgi:hypothetical protein